MRGSSLLLIPWLLTLKRASTIENLPSKNQEQWLFSVFTSQITNCIEYCKCHLYADDTKLYFSFKHSNVFRAQDLMNTDLTNVLKFYQYGLKLNASKISAVLCHYFFQCLRHKLRIVLSTANVASMQMIQNYIYPRINPLWYNKQIWDSKPDHNKTRAVRECTSNCSKESTTPSQSYWNEGLQEIVQN